MGVIGGMLQNLPLTPQGDEVTAVCEARDAAGGRLYSTVVILLPRRSTKTTAVLNVVLGRCETQPGHLAVFTAQDGVRARNTFRRLMRVLASPAVDFEGRHNPANRRGKLRWSNGEEAIEWDNGSRWWVVPPTAESFRSEAADTVIFDEAGEYSPETSEDLVSGALPLTDTRPLGQVIIAGTPGKVRAGLLWDYINNAQDPKQKGVGGVLYFMRDSEDCFTIDDQGQRVPDRSIIRRVHPGIGTVTTYATIVDRFHGMKPELFEREYMCRYPMGGTTGAILPLAWEACGVTDQLPARPERIAWAFDVEPDSSAAALVAAWRDEDGRPHLELARFEEGTQWLAAAARQIQRTYRGAPIGCDNVGANSDAAGRMGQVGIRLQLLSMRHTIGATARLAEAIHNREARHYRQPLLDDAAASAVWRTIGDSGRLFGRRAASAATSPMVAAAVALWLWDQQHGRPQQPIGIVRVGGAA